MFLRYFQITRMIHIPYTRQNSIHSKKKICWLVYIFHADDFHRLTHQTYSVKMAVYWPRSFVLRTWSISSRDLDQILIGFCQNYFSYFKRYFDPAPNPPTLHPRSSIKCAPLNKARVLKYSRKCGESLSSTLWKRKLWVTLDCVNFR